MLQYIFEGLNATITIYEANTYSDISKINLSLSYRRFRNFNKQNVITYKDYHEYHSMIFDSKNSMVCHIPLNIDHLNNLLLKYNEKYNHFEEIKEEIENKSLKVGDVIVKTFNDQKIYYVIIKENYWDNLDYDILFDCYENLKNILSVNEETTISIPKLEYQYNNITWDKVRIILKYIFKDSNIKINVYKNRIINPDKNEIESIIKEFHTSVTSGHPGVSRTIDEIKIKYYWPTIKQDVIKFIKKCDSCQRNKLVRKKQLQPMEITTTAKTSFEKIFLDIVGPLHDTESQNTYILTLQDDLTKFSQAYPLQDHTAETVANIFVCEFICKFGTPNIIVTDQGSEFMSELFGNVTKLFKIKKFHSTAYHPQTNGALERSHQTLMDYVKHFVNEYQNNWDTWIDFAMLSYNSTPHTVTKHTPYELVFGKKPNLPTTITSISEPYYTYEDYLSDLKVKLNNSYHIAKNFIENYKERNKVYFDKKSRPADYRVGDKVLLKKETFENNTSKKLQSRYEGPYEIIKVKSPNCTIQYKRNKHLTVHFNRIKKYYNPKD